MKIIMAAGMLGNQMIYYVYALYFKKILNEEVKFDLSVLNNLKFLYRWGLIKDIWILDEIFKVNVEKSCFRENLKMRGGYMTFMRYNCDLSDLEKIIFGKNRWFKKKFKPYSHLSMEAVLEEKGNQYLNFTPIVDPYLFDKIYPEIMEAFQFSKILDSKNLSTMNVITTTSSVAIHLRCYYHREKDLKGEEERSLLFDYLKSAIEKIKQKIKNPHFFIFYDFENTKNYFIQKFSEMKNLQFVDWNRGKQSYIDLQLMSSCQHNILSISTFSWWSGYLNQNKNKIVCYPKKERYGEFYPRYNESIYPHHWRAI